MAGHDSYSGTLKALTIPYGQRLKDPGVKEVLVVCLTSSHVLLASAVQLLTNMRRLSVSLGLTGSAYCDSTGAAGIRSLDQFGNAEEEVCLWPRVVVVREDCCSVPVGGKNQGGFRCPH